MAKSKIILFPEERTQHASYWAYNGEPLLHSDQEVLIIFLVIFLSWARLWYPLPQWTQITRFEHHTYCSEAQFRASSLTFRILLFLEPQSSIDEFSKNAAFFLGVSILFVSATEGLRLPKNYQPIKQHLEYSFYAADARIEGKTILNLKCDKDQLNCDTITLNVPPPLQIDRVDIGNQTNVSFELMPEKETMRIQVEQFSQELLLVIHFRRNVLAWARGGMYAPTSSGGLVTFFEPSFARTAFPCFDEPSFRTVFSASIQVFQQPEKFPLVKFNSVLKSSEIREKSRFYEFVETRPLPSYLVAIAVLGPGYITFATDYYFGIPIIIMLTKSEHFFRHSKIDEDVLKTKFIDVIKNTLSAAETKFDTKWSSTDTDIIFTEMPARIGGMEHPGLITVDGKIKQAEVVCEVFVHEIIHQWTKQSPHMLLKRL